jgi:hypothetical protein
MAERTEEMKKIYLSMPYRGALGDNAGDEEIFRNIDRARAVSLEIKRHFPKVFVFVPHIETGQYHNAWREGKITSDEILEICCKDVESCDLLLSVGNISSGMELEINTAIAKPIPVLIFEEFTDKAQQELAETLRAIGAFDENLP